jgi:ribokinase
LKFASVLVLGSINVDLVIRGSKLPAPGETVLGGDFFQMLGGKGANQAITAARASAAPVLFVAAVGDDDYGQTARRRLAEENVICEQIHTIANASTGTACIMVDDAGENLISVASGANAQLAVAHIDALDNSVFCSAKVFLACLESPLDTVQRGLERARDANLTTILNPAPAHRDLVSSGILSLVDVLTPNENEAALLTGSKVGSEADAIAAGRRLCDSGCRNVIVTLGAAGCVIIQGTGEVGRVVAHKVQAVDTTAAGDAFNGALATALAEGQSLPLAAAWANAAASISVTRIGAVDSLPTREEIIAVRDP